MKYLKIAGLVLVGMIAGSFIGYWMDNKNGVGN
jgi:hypothetical protein